MPEKSVLLTYPWDIYCKWHRRYTALAR